MNSDAGFVHVVANVGCYVPCCRFHSFWTAYVWKMDYLWTSKWSKRI